MNRKLNIANFVFSMLIGLTLIFSAVKPVNVSASDSFIQDGIRRSVHPQTGKLSFLGADPSKPILIAKAMEGGLAPESRGVSNVEMYAREFGIQDASRELRVMRSTGAEGRMMVKYQQVYNDIPVIAGELIVNMRGDGGLLSINGEVSPELNLNTQPKLKAAEARQRALALVSQTYNLAEEELSISEPELWIFDERLIQDNATQPVHLVWRMEVTSGNAPLRELVLVNAQTGNISLHFNQIDAAWSGNPSPVKDDAVNPEAIPVAEPVIQTDSTPITRYVNGDSGVDADECTLSENPCKNIQYAIMKAVAGDTIAVTKGVYKYVSVPDSGNVETPGQVTPRQVILLNKTVNLSGGWDTTFNSQTGLSVLDAEHGRYGILVSIPVEDVTEIDHFGIKNGTAGIYKFIGKLVIRNSSIFDNDGIGLWNTQLPLTVENVTISNNGGHGISTSGTLTITNATISSNKNTGLSHNGIATAILRNTIIADNATDCTGTITSAGYNIIGNTAGCIITATPDDQFGVDPQLATFLPSRGYQPLQVSSPAIEAANPVYCPALDQRGIERLPAGNTQCDIGAYEYTTPGVAAIVSVETGANQRTRIDGDYADPLEVSVLDAQGSPVAGETVTFTAPASGPSVVFQGSGINSEGPFITNGSGIVTTSLMTANSAFGAFTVIADAGSVGTANIPLENLAWKWYVSNSGNNSNSCNVPTEPCEMINAAVEKANATDTIYVAEGTYTSAELTDFTVVTIKKSITLSGGWNNSFTEQTGYSTVDGQNARRGMDISGPYTVNLNHFEVKNGKGSGISSYQGILTVEHSYFHDNNYDGGSGGGIRSSSGKLNISRSTFYNNSAGSGGGVYVSGYNSYEAVLDYVTISGNHADYGGGIYVNDPGSFVVKNSIIANNTAATEGPDCKTTAQMPSISGGNNIVGTTCGTQQPTDLFNINPGLGVFLPEQGYIPLYPDSPAVNHSDPTCAEDQRGVAAIDVCDAGAFEFITNTGTPESIWAVSGNDQRTPPSQAFLQPLTAVVLDAQGNPVHGIGVTFNAPASNASATFQATGGLSEGPLTTNEVGAVTSSTVIANGIPGGYAITADGGGAGTVDFSMTNAAWYVAPTGNDTSNSCSIVAEPCATINGAIAKVVSGDTIFVTQDVYTGTGTEVVFTDKSIHLSGGWNETFDTQDGYTTINGENARQGIVIEKEYVSTPIQVIVDHFIVRNGYLGFGSGGGIDNEYETLELSDSILEWNYAPNGGGLFSSGTSSLNRVTIRYNKATWGGGIKSDGKLLIENSAIHGNIASQYGGGVRNGSELTIQNSTIFENQALANAGGGVLTYSTKAVTLNNVTISDNYAGEYGGGIVNDRPSNYTPYPVVTNTIVAGNQAGSFNGNDCGGKIIFQYSLIQNTAGCLIANPVGNILNTDPLLLVFLPTEGYIPLRAESPAMGKGDPATPGSSATACLATDQRGASRSNRCDMGSYEYKAPVAGDRIVPVTYGLRAAPNAAFPERLRVAVLDLKGSPIGGGTLTFSASTGTTGSSGTFANGSNVESNVAVDVNGLATSSVFTANEFLGDYDVEVSRPGLSSGNIPLSNFAWYVRTDGDDSNPCTSPSQPCLTINKAIEKAQTGDTIYVAEGRYTGSVVRITTSVKITGGWTADFSAKGNPTIIDGQRVNAGVLNTAPSVLLARLHIENAIEGLSNVNSMTLDQVAIVNNVGTGIINGDGSFDAILVIRNSTISYNREGGIANLHGTLTINNSTITNNVRMQPTDTGGGIQNYGGTAKIRNTIIAYNTAPTGPDCYNYAPEGGSLTSQGYNIVGTTLGCSMTAKTGDKFNVDPKLSALLPLGYLPLTVTSPARNAGNPLSCTDEDQRGVSRLTNTCDIGAYEYKTPGTAVDIVAVHPEIRRTAIDTPFSSSLSVAAVDKWGSPVGGVAVDFAAPASGPSGTFLSTGGFTESLSTDSSGFATSSIFTANDETGDYDVTATAPALPGRSAVLRLHNGAWLVAPTGSDASTDCLSLATPCRTIDGVLSKKEFTDGDVIWVAAGTYFGTGGVYYIKRVATVVGGWNPSFTGLGGATLLRGSYYIHGDVTFKNVVFTGAASLTNFGKLVLENSSYYGTELGILNEGYGDLILINVTMTKNGNYYPPIRNAGGNVLIVNSTITGNKGITLGGIRNEGTNGTIILKDTILAGNTVTNPVDYASRDCAGDFVSLGHNIIGTVGKSSGGVYPCRANWQESDRYGDDSKPIQASTILNPSPVQNALTGQWHHPLKLSGPAVDAGNEALPGSGGNACPATDQLGRLRPQGARCDIGAVEYKFDSHPADSLLVTYTAKNSTVLPGTKLCESNNAVCGASDAKAKNAHKYAYSAYKWYLTWHGRNSLDGNGLQIMSAVHYGSDYQDSFWNGYMLVYGDGYGFPLADDIVAHEYTHGVTQYESNLFPWYQSGAINESFSDLWGEAVDYHNGLGNDASSVQWLIGEDISGLGAIRDMKNPPAFKQPDSMTSALYCESGPCLDDDGGAHVNSGVNNKAAYLMVAGDTFNGRTVTKLGWDKVLTIYYEAQTNLLTSGSDYLDLHNALYQACLNKVGVGGITNGNCQEVRDATLAVKMNQQPAANFNPDVADCPAGTYPVKPELFKDDFESGSDGWTIKALQGASAWGLSERNAAGGAVSLWSDDGYHKSDSYASTPGIKLPLGAKSYLHFTHAFGFEATSTAYYDGGVLEYSVTDGKTWLDASGLFSAGQNYKGTIKTGNGNRLEGRSAFVGDSHGYVDSRYNLTTLAGKTVRFRWRMGTDTAESVVGWFVDDVRIYTCVSLPSRPVPQKPTNESTVTYNPPLLNWSDSAPDLHHYVLHIDTVDTFNSENLKKYLDIPSSEFRPEALAPGTYYWRVKAYNAAGKSSPWSVVWWFKVP